MVVYYLLLYKVIYLLKYFQILQIISEATKGVSHIQPKPSHSNTMSNLFHFLLNNYHEATTNEKEANGSFFKILVNFLGVGQIFVIIIT